MTVDLERYAGRPVSRETYVRLEQFAGLLRIESGRQNLVSRSTLGELWERHIADSAQLLRYAPRPSASWVDVGSGAGLPGIVVACLGEESVGLLEPRRLRAQFLRSVVDDLSLSDRVTVRASKVQAVTGAFDVITARAVASVDAVLAMTVHLSHPGTVWVLPRGRGAKSELEEARRNWHCQARAEVSMTDPDSEILVLHAVHSKGKR